MNDAFYIGAPKALYNQVGGSLLNTTSVAVNYCRRILQSKQLTTSYKIHCNSQSQAITVAFFII